MWKSYKYLFGFWGGVYFYDVPETPSCHVVYVDVTVSLETELDSCSPKKHREMFNPVILTEGHDANRETW